MQLAEGGEAVPPGGHVEVLVEDSWWEGRVQTAGQGASPAVVQLATRRSVPAEPGQLRRCLVWEQGAWHQKATDSAGGPCCKQSATQQPVELQPEPCYSVDGTASMPAAAPQPSSRDSIALKEFQDSNFLPQIALAVAAECCCMAQVQGKGALRQQRHHQTQQELLTRGSAWRAGRGKRLMMMRLPPSSFRQQRALLRRQRARARGRVRHSSAARPS